jgi:hypothetical protein
MTETMNQENLSALEQYGVDLTARARDGKLDPVIGRHEEIRRALQILSRRTKSNPVLIGEVLFLMHTKSIIEYKLSLSHNFFIVLGWGRKDSHCGRTGTTVRSILLFGY